MNDQWIAVIVGAATMIALRVLDFYLPRGWVSKWTKRHADPADDTADDDDTINQ